jgi:hypothetical protein
MGRAAVRMALHDVGFRRLGKVRRDCRDKKPSDMSLRGASRLLPWGFPRGRRRHADAEEHGDRSVAAGGCGVGGVRMRGTAGAVDPRQGPEHLHIAAGNRDGDASRSAVRRIGIVQRQQGQPVGEVAAAVMRRTTASTSRVRVLRARATVMGRPAYQTCSIAKGTILVRS